MDATGKLQLIRNDSLTERVYSELRRALMLGTFLSGDSLTIRSLSTQMGIGITPVRDAVQRLAAEGALEVLRNRAIKVPHLTRSEFEEIYDIRLALEGMATAKAAAQMRPEILRSIEQLATQVGECARGAPAEQLLSLNIDFHFTIYRAAHSQHLMDFIEALWLRIGPLMILPLKQDPAARARYTAVFTGPRGLHRKLVEALKAQHPEQARAALCAIIERAAQWYRSHHSFAPERQDTQGIVQAQAD